MLRGTSQPPPPLCRTRQVITSAEFHPQHCNVFAYSSSKGCIRLADMRSSALCDQHAKAFEEPESQVRAAQQQHVAGAAQHWPA